MPTTFMVNGQDINNVPGFYMCVGYRQSPETYNTSVSYAQNRSDARSKFVNQYSTVCYTAVFVVRQEDY
jgi:hypothetical protein